MKKKTTHQKQQAISTWIRLESNNGSDMWRQARYARAAALQFYVTQAAPNSCGLATMCIVLNALHGSRLFEEHNVLVPLQS